MASTPNRGMKLTEWEQLGLALRREKAVQTKWQPVRGLDVREIPTRPAEGEECLLTSPSIGHFHTPDGDYELLSKKALH